MKRGIVIVFFIVLAVLFALITSSQLDNEGNGLCSDNDGGINYDIRGGAVPKGGDDITYDYCNGNLLIEFSCDSDSADDLDIGEYACENGCENGACKPMLTLPFIRGDINVDGVISINDATHLLSFFYGADKIILCEDSADVNDDGVVNINDAVVLIDFLFVGNVKELPSPNLKEEVDLTLDNLKC